MITDVILRLYPKSCVTLGVEKSDQVPGLFNIFRNSWTQSVSSSIEHPPGYVETIFRLVFKFLKSIMNVCIECIAISVHTGVSPNLSAYCSLWSLQDWLGCGVNIPLETWQTFSPANSLAHNLAGRLPRGLGAGRKQT